MSSSFERQLRPTEVPQMHPQSAIAEKTSEQVQLTKENTHTVPFEDLVYPESHKKATRLPYEISRMIQSVCSIADRYHKPFVQINFANGTRVFTYKRKKGYVDIKRGAYSFSLVSHPDVVDDFTD